MWPESGLGALGERDLFLGYFFEKSDERRGPSLRERDHLWGQPILVPF